MKDIQMGEPNLNSIIIMALSKVSSRSLPLALSAYRSLELLISGEMYINQL